VFVNHKAILNALDLSVDSQSSHVYCCRHVVGKMKHANFDEFETWSCMNTRMYYILPLSNQEQLNFPRNLRAFHIVFIKTTNVSNELYG